MASTYFLARPPASPRGTTDPDRDAEVLREFEHRQDGRRLAAELARQVDDCRRIAKRQSQQHFGAGAMLAELAQFVRVVDHESTNPKAQRCTDFSIGLDRVRVDAALGATPRRLDEPDLARRRHVETAAEIAQFGDHRRVRQGFQGIKQADSGQCGLQCLVLATDDRAIQQEQRRAVLRDRAP